MATHKTNVTMKTISEEAGVTLTTVSRILNNKGGKYAESTKKKIFEIAKRHKYRPNALVHGMQSGKTDTAGVMLPISAGYYGEIVVGIHNTFAANNTIMLLGWGENIQYPEDDTRERQVILQLVDRRVDGVILRPGSEALERSYFEEIWERNIPLILVDREMSKIKTNFVGTDDIAGGIAATKHLIELGHRRLLFVGSSELVSTSRHREKGFRNVLSETPNASGQTIDTHSLDNDNQDLRENLINCLNKNDAPTAIFCYCDPCAEAVAKILMEEGISIPGDISLVGFGNQPCPSSPVPLTTFDQHPQLIGKTAAEIYLDCINEGKNSSTRIERIPADLLIRASTRSLSN